MPRGSDEERYYREKHLENNTFDTDEDAAADLFRRESVVPSAGGADEREGDGGRGCFVAGEEVRVIVVGVRDVRIADWKGSVQDWVIAPPGGENGGAVDVNGVR